MIRTAAIAALVAGGVLMAQGFWIPTKAALAQLLLEASWQRVRSGALAPRPWPWADVRPLARLRIPGHDVSAIVLDGATGASLAFGPGRLSGTARPGERGHSVLFGHRDTHFAVLEHLEEGQQIVIERPDGRQVGYRVRHRQIVHETRHDVVAQDGSDRLSLITCYPFGAARPRGPLRFVVSAEREPPPLEWGAPWAPNALPRSAESGVARATGRPGRH